MSLCDIVWPFPFYSAQCGRRGVKKVKNILSHILVVLGMGKYIPKVFIMNSVKIIGFQDFEVGKFL